jgi:hypothetical protein
MYRTENAHVKYCNRMALVLTHSYSLHLWSYLGFHSLHRISLVLGLSLAHSYIPRLPPFPGFTAVCFPTKMINNHLATTVHEPARARTHTHTHLASLSLHSDRSPHPLMSNWLALFSQMHYSQLPLYIGHIPVLSRTQSREQTSRAVKELLFTTITGTTEPCYSIF